MPNKCKSKRSRLTLTVIVILLALAKTSAYPFSGSISSDSESAATKNYEKAAQSRRFLRSLSIDEELSIESSKTRSVSGGPGLDDPNGRKVKLNNALVASQQQAPDVKLGSKGKVRSENIKRASPAGSAFKDGLKAGLSVGNADFAGDILVSAVRAGGNSVSGQDTIVERGLDKARDTVGNVGDGIINTVGGATGTGALLAIPAGIAGVGLGLAVQNSKLGDIRRVMTIVKTGAVVTGQQNLIGLQKKQNQG